MTTRTSASITRVAEQGIRAAIVAVLLVGVRRRDPGAVVNAVLALVGTVLPDLIERRCAVAFRPWQLLYVETAMLTHAVGMLGPYDEIRWWDHLTHTHSASLLAGVVHVLARRADRDPLLHVVVGVAGAGALWELVEYVTHGLSRRVGLDPLLVSYGRTDTLLDLGFDLLGALVVVVFGDRLLANFLPSDE